MRRFFRAEFGFSGGVAVTLGRARHQNMKLSGDYRSVDWNDFRLAEHLIGKGSCS
ncbi:MAG: hypothetical protein GXP04_06650 [Alphaproteobacteria bacterium]|nr:hypothetical protein [Alphaproteobacteria bacterium]